MSDNELKHYGVPGMKWGVRKKTDDVKRKRREAKADNDNDDEHEDYKKTIATKSLKSMSTKEIQEINNRIQAENQFKELNKSGFDKFKDKVKSVLSEVATNQAKSFINHYADAGREKIQDAIDEKTGLGQMLGLKDKAEINAIKAENEMFKLIDKNNEQREAHGFETRFKKRLDDKKVDDKDDIETDDDESTTSKPAVPETKKETPASKLISLAKKKKKKK